MIILKSAFIYQSELVIIIESKRKRHTLKKPTHPKTLKLVMVFSAALSSSTFTLPSPLRFHSLTPRSTAFPHRKFFKTRMEAQTNTTDHAANPKEAKLWGGRFQESVTDTVERFTESVSYDKQLYKHDILGSTAHATMLAKQVIIISNFNYLI